MSYYHIKDAVLGKDIICTDALPESLVEEFKDCRVTMEVMELENEGAVLNPCPPFYRGEEGSDEVIESFFFVGYEFKKCLMEVQQAVMIFCMSE